MDMGFDTASGRSPRWADEVAGRVDARRSEWHGLRARLAAARALRLALAWGGPSHAPVAGGSFNRRAARMLAAYARDLGFGLGGINRVVSDLGKLNDDRVATAAGAFAAGDRG
jgi:hypothetical protein